MVKGIEGDKETHDSRRGCGRSDIRRAVEELRPCEVPTRKDEEGGEGNMLETHKLDGDGGGVEEVCAWDRV